MVERVVADLADAREVPAFDPESARPSSPEAPPLKVAFGTIPDYTENPAGFRINGASGGSAAAAAGLLAGDIIVQFGEARIHNIYDYMSALSTCKPGDKVVVKWLREGREMQAEALLKGR